MKTKKTFLGEFEELVLLAILQLKDNAYGVTIRHMIEETTERSTSYGAIYATLDRLEKKGFISSRRGEATAERGGRAKRYYQVESTGISAINDTQSARNNIMKGLDLNPNPA